MVLTQRCCRRYRGWDGLRFASAAPKLAVRVHKAKKYREKVMKLEIKELTSDKFDEQSKGVVILPHNYLSEEKEEYHSTTLSFYKYSKEKVEIAYLTEPELLVEQRSGEWFGPVILFTSMALSENPELVSITCGIIANYVTDFFKGQKEPSVRLKFIHKETKTSKLTEISYEGGLEGLGKLEESILEVVSKSSVND